MISIIDGGINNPRVPDPAKLPNNIFSGYFLFLNSGIDIFPTVATVAAEDPDIAANNAQPTTFTCTKPPGNFDNQGDKPLNKFSDSLVLIKFHPSKQRGEELLMSRKNLFPILLLPSHLPQV